MPVAQAWLSAVRSLFSPGVLWHLFWPALLALLAWGLALYFGLGPIADGLTSWLAGLPWLGDWIAHGWLNVATGSALRLMLILLSVPFAFVFAVLLVALLALPLILDRVARIDYADLAQRGGGSMLGSAVNAIKALVLLVCAGLVCLPLLFVPGLGLLVILLLSAWFNVRCFRYDALMIHADVAELRRLPAAHRAPLFGIGLVGSALGLVPLLNLLAPILTGLAFTHYLLAALRSERMKV